MTEILERSTIEILGAVDDYRLRFNPFGKVLDRDNGEGVVSLGWCEFAHDIDAPPLNDHEGAINYEGCAGALQRWDSF
jgi:hypothetical protein